MSEKVLDDLRNAALAAAHAGYYGDYIVAVVHTALIRARATMNPDDEREEVEAER